MTGSLTPMTEATVDANTIIPIPVPAELIALIRNTFFKVIIAFCVLLMIQSYFTARHQGLSVPAIHLSFCDNCFLRSQGKFIFEYESIPTAIYPRLAGLCRATGCIGRTT